VHSYQKLNPDIVVLLGDRCELISAATPAVLAKVPVAHIHGGEITEGAVDNVVRHCITKMSVFHFASTEIFRRRIIQMGEEPRFVFNYGAPGLDNLYRLKLLDRNELEKALGFDLNGTVSIITYHPVTLSIKPVETQINTLLEAVDGFCFKVIFTMANADIGGSIINKKIRDFCSNRPGKCKFSKNLGQIVYLSCLKNFDVMIGNSSSGMIEACSLGLPVVNIGDRQAGRVRGTNVIDVNCSKSGIQKGINIALSRAFNNKIRNAKNPYDKYGDGKTCYRIKEKLKKIKISPGLIKKKFYDLNFNTVSV
jgi:UDP-hydrolysing UDP-N-acetyl-D-glucosamine 2-epimerase